jgi:hypothetical protein
MGGLFQLMAFGAGNLGLDARLARRSSEDAPPNQSAQTYGS